jgi:hypothetical protein
MSETVRLVVDVIADDFEREEMVRRSGWGVGLSLTVTISDVSRDDGRERPGCRGRVISEERMPDEGVLLEELGTISVAVDAVVIPETLDSGYDVETDVGEETVSVEDETLWLRPREDAGSEGMTLELSCDSTKLGDRMDVLTHGSNGVIADDGAGLEAREVDGMDMASIDGLRVLGAIGIVYDAEDGRVIDNVRGEEM